MGSLPANERDRNFAYRIGDAVTSQVANVAVGAAVAIATSVYGSLDHDGRAKDVLFGVLVVLSLGVVASQIWLRRAYLRLRRADAKIMADPVFFDLVRRDVERDLAMGYEDIAVGLWRVYASEVQRIGLELLRKLSAPEVSNKVVRATDLTTNPELLGSRSEYLAGNRRFISSGGVVKRLFIVRRQDLLAAGFAEELLALITQHRSIGVQCGIEVRDRLRPEQAVDFVLFGVSGVLIEEQQGDADYLSGRSSVDFRNVDRWIGIFDTLWPENGVPTPVMRLQQYEATVRQLLGENAWDALRVGKALDSVD